MVEKTQWGTLRTRLEVLAHDTIIVRVFTGDQVLEKTGKYEVVESVLRSEILNAGRPIPFDIVDDRLILQIGDDREVLRRVK